jgi:hypothetical protein
MFHQDFSTDWIQNILSISDAYQSQQNLSDKKNIINGYIQQTIINRQFSMYLHCYEQLKCIKAIPPLQRVFHFDSTGGLVKISKKDRDYQRMYNYIMLLKDVTQLGIKDSNSVPVAELASISHGVYRISDFLRA